MHHECRWQANLNASDFTVTIIDWQGRRVFSVAYS